MATIRYASTDSQFWSVLKQRVNAYFVTQNIKQTGDARLYVKAWISIPLAITLYTILVYFTPENNWVSLMLCIILGFDLAFIGFNVMHDASHESYSEKRWVNRMMVSVLALMGASVVLWIIKHVKIHHIFTNTKDDDDISFHPPIRSRKEEKFYWFHKYQHRYGPILYFFLYISWVFVLDFKKYFNGKIGDKEFKLSRYEHFAFWVCKIYYILFFLVIPIYRIGVLETMVGYLVISAITGFTISIVFQLAHVVETSTFPEENPETGKIDISWAESQIQETTDFSTKNRILSWFLGGLNFQVIHHLFPKISHVHYFRIQKIVRDTCAEYKIKYNELSFFGAVRSHIRTLKRLGRQEQTFA